MNNFYPQSEFIYFHFLLTAFLVQYLSRVRGRIFPRTAAGIPSLSPENSVSSSELFVPVGQDNMK